MNGMKRVAKMVKRFTSIVDELKKGKDELKAELDSNAAIIDAFKTKNVELGSSVKEADRLIRGIDNLLNGGTV
jgi:hypothetical protein